MKKRVVRILVTVSLLAVFLPVAAYYYVFGRPHPADPEQAVISFEDLRRFARTHQRAGGNAATFQEQYFDLNSRPVRVWESQFGISSGSLAQHLRERPALYVDLDARVAKLTATEPDIRQAYSELKNRYPEAVFSPLYVFFGAYSIRSLIRPFGILFAGEYFTGMPAPMDPQSPHYLNGLMSAPEMIVSQAIHEQAHIQQARRNPLAMFTNTVLERAIYEGTADYVAELVTGAHNSAAAHDYLASNGDALWCLFYRSIEASYQSRWIDAERFGRPPAGIIGAFGYHITRAYYDSFEDPRDGFHALLQLEAYDEIYSRSGLRDRLAGRCAHEPLSVNNPDTVFARKVISGTDIAESDLKTQSALNW